MCKLLMDALHKPDLPPIFMNRFRTRGWFAEALIPFAAGALSRHVQWVASSCKPVVGLDLLKTGCNGWVTERRFGRLGPCCFCNAVVSEDSTEHAATCSVVWGLLLGRLPGLFRGHGMTRLLGVILTMRIEVVAHAVVLHALVASHNQLRTTCRGKQLEPLLLARLRRVSRDDAGARVAMRSTGTH